MTIPKVDHVKEVQRIEEENTVRIQKIVRRTIYSVTVLLAVAVLAVGFLFNRTLSHLRDNQVAGCERGNLIREVLRDQNDLDIQILTDEIAVLKAIPSKTAKDEELLSLKISTKAKKEQRRESLKSFDCKVIEN